LEKSLSSCTLRCYLLDLSDEDVEELIAALKQQVPVTDTDVFNSWVNGLPRNVGAKWLALNATVLNWTGRAPQGIGMTNRTIASVLNKNEVLTPLRKELARQSLKMVGKGGVKIWGRVGSKLVPIVGWFSLGYEAVKACNCAVACEDDKFLNKEKIIGQ